MKKYLFIITQSLMIIILGGCNIGGYGMKLPSGVNFKLLDQENGKPITGALFYSWDYLYEPAAAMPFGICGIQVPSRFTYKDGEYYDVKLFKNSPGVVYIMVGPEHIKNQEVSKIVPFYSSDFKDGTVVIYLTKEE